MHYLIVLIATFLSFTASATQTTRGIAFYGENLTIAIQTYENGTTEERIDCDPVDGGPAYICANYLNPLLSDFEPATDVGTVPFNPNENPQLSWGDSYSHNGECYIESTFDHGIGDVLVDTPHGQKTVREVAIALGTGPSSFGNPLYNDVQCGNGPANNAGDEDYGRCAGRVDIGVNGCGLIGPKWNLERAFPSETAVENNPSTQYTDGDLLIVQWDSSYGWETMQSMVATRTILDKFPSTEFIVVNGSRQDSTATIAPDSSNIMQTLFPNGVDAYSDYTHAIETVALSIKLTLDMGATVHIAQAGPSDWIADVIRHLQSINTMGLKRIRVVQNNNTVSEQATLPDNLALIVDVVTYVVIDDGNIANNTPDFNPNSDNDINRARDEFIPLATSSTYGDTWSIAFGYGESNRPVDFSDVVSVLHILGISTATVNDVFKFAAMYFNTVAADRYVVFGSNLDIARNNYVSDLPRVDCDPYDPNDNGKGWLCASYKDPVAADLPQSSIVVTPPTTPTMGITNDKGYVIQGMSLSNAMANYIRNATLPRMDCDEMADGTWLCASYVNPTLDDLNSNPTVITPPTVTPPTVTPPPSNELLTIQAENGTHVSGSGWAIENTLTGFDGSGYITWRGADKYRVTDSNPPAGIKAFDFIVTTAGVYEFVAKVQARVGNGNAAGDADNDAWVKFTSGNSVSGIRGDSSKWTKFFVGGNDETWKNYTSGEQYDPTFFTRIQRTLPVGTHRILLGGRSSRFAIDSVGLNLLSTTTTTTLPNTNNVVGSNTIPSDSRFKSSDLIVVEYDSCPDPDDIHASVAGKMVLDYYGLITGDDYIVVNGTCGEELNRSNFIQDSPQIFNKLYGSQGSVSTWSDVFNQYDASVSRIATQVVLTLNAGNNVWVAAGGPMDFTSDVIRRVQIISSSLDTKKINVIQHSSGSGAFNESKTDDANMNYVRHFGNYITIDNGNVGNNRTPNLNEQSPTQVNRFRTSNMYGDDWTLAFNLFNPVNRFDGSDTVEILWILGIESDEIQDWKTFGDRFIR